MKHFLYNEQRSVRIRTDFIFMVFNDSDFFAFSCVAGSETKRTRERDDPSATTQPQLLPGSSLSPSLSLSRKMKSMRIHSLQRKQIDVSLESTLQLSALQSSLVDLVLLVPLRSLPRYTDGGGGDDTFRAVRRKTKKGRRGC